MYMHMCACERVASKKKKAAEEKVVDAQELIGWRS